MIFELVGSRIIGPYVGTSTYSWTSLIGVILASLSLGYYFGGRLADKKPTVEPLSLILALSAIFISITALTKDFVSALVGSLPIILEFKSIIISLLLFAPASYLLGMVSPYAVRLRARKVESVGEMAGGLYALSTLGSIVGTFLAGFYIIPNFGSTSALFILTILLLVASAILSREKSFRKSNLFFLMLIFLISTALFVCEKNVNIRKISNQKIIADLDTEYNRIWVYKGVDRMTKKPTINLATDSYGTQAAVFADGTEDLVFSYTKYYRLAKYFTPNIKNALTIGGCVYSQPRDFLRSNPFSSIDVVEIDPGMTKAARQYFNYSDDPRLTIIHEDGRIYLNNNTKKYDAVFIDAFNSASSVPFHLTTKESAKKVFESLNSDGVMIMNLISAVEGEKGKFLRAEYATYKEIFPQVYVFPVDDPQEGDSVQNIILVASRKPLKPTFSSENEEIATQLSHLWQKPIASDVPVLTDDYAPVEFYKRLSIGSAGI